MPIDYYSPDFFNLLQPHTWNHIVMQKVALLPLVGQLLTWNNDEHLSDKAFAKKYGAPVFAQYKMVDDADVADFGDDEWVGEDNMDEDIADNDMIDVDDMAASYSNLSDQLSISSV